MNKPSKDDRGVAAFDEFMDSLKFDAPTPEGAAWTEAALAQAEVRRLKRGLSALAFALEEHDLPELAGATLLFRDGQTRELTHPLVKPQ